MKIIKLYIPATILIILLVGLSGVVWWKNHSINRIKYYTGIDIPFTSSKLLYKKFNSSFAGEAELYVYKITDKTMSNILQYCKNNKSMKVGIYDYKLVTGIYANTLNRTAAELRLGTNFACSSEYSSFLENWIIILENWIIIIDHGYVFFEHSRL